MGRVTSTKVGRGNCPDCKETVTYRLSQGGMLTHKCDCCDSSGYAHPGGQAFKERMATIKNPIVEADETPVQAPAEKSAPGTPVQKKQNSVFSFADLK